MESMELHQHTFSSHLEDDDPSHKDNRSDVGVGGGVSTPLVRRKMATHSHGHHGHQRRLSIPSSSFKDAIVLYFSSLQTRIAIVTSARAAS